MRRRRGPPPKQRQAKVRNKGEHRPNPKRGPRKRDAWSKTRTAKWPAHLPPRKEARKRIFQLHELSRPTERPFKISATLFQFDQCPPGMPKRGMQSTSLDIQGILTVGGGDLRFQVAHPGNDADKLEMMRKFGMVPGGRFSVHSTMMPNQNFNRYLGFVHRRGDVIMVHTIDNAGKDTSVAKKVLDPHRINTIGRRWWFYITEKIVNERWYYRLSAWMIW